MPHLHYILATAGHVDHGKSALVEALTGTHPSRLPEEKSRGITIDLGFARLVLPHPDQPETLFDLGVIDVPGHEDFVKNMVAGVATLDLALLVVAADDGWMPQTEEHLQILDYLGVQEAVVALAKADLVTDVQARIDEVRAQLRRSRFARAPVVPVSSVTGSGLGELRTALAVRLAAVPALASNHKPRLWVDRALSLHGAGTIVTGTLRGGELAKGDSIVVEPGGAPARIRSVQSHNADLGRAGPGRRVALNLPELTVALPNEPRTGAGSVRRGDLITVPALGGSARTWDVLLVRSDRQPPAGPAREGAPRFLRGTQRDLKDDCRVWIHHGSGRAVGRIALLEGRTMPPGLRGLAQLRLEEPLPAFVGDRFVLRDWGEEATLAGGTVLNPSAARRGARTPERRQALQRRAAGLGDLEVLLETELEFHAGFLEREGLLVKSPHSSESVRETADSLVRQGRIREAGSWLVASSRWDECVQKARDAVEANHLEHPELIGLELNRLRAHLGRVLPHPDLLDALLRELGRCGYVHSGLHVRRLTHRPALPASLQAAGERVRAALALRPLEPPSRREIAPDPAAGQALRFLLETGQVVEIGPDLVLLAEHYKRALILVKGHLRRHGPATVSQLRGTLGTSRRIIVPLLEKLDREGITLRDGDLRRLAGAPVRGPSGLGLPEGGSET